MDDSDQVRPLTRLTPTKSDAVVLQRLQKACRRWGGGLQQVTPQIWRRLKACSGFFPAPQKEIVGIHWPSRHIYYVGIVHWGSLIHEMGHTFASHNDPESSSEDLFLGWEYQVVRFIGAPLEKWLDYMKDYGTDEGQFEDLSARKRRRFIQECVMQARAHGSLDHRWCPRPLGRVFESESLLCSLDVDIDRQRRRLVDLGKRSLEYLSQKDFEDYMHGRGYLNGLKAARAAVRDHLHSGLLERPLNLAALPALAVGDEDDEDR